MDNSTGGPLRPALGGQVHPREYEHEAGYRAYLFGSFRVFRGQRPLGEETPRREKALLMLQWFLLNPGRPSSADEFIELFWPGISLRKAVGSFHVTMHCLRRMLEPDLNARQESAFIRRTPNNLYVFHSDDSWWTDVDDVGLLFERATACDARGEGRRACFYYRRVADYCIQGLLAGDDSGDWLLPYRSRYEQIYTQVLMRLMQLHEHSGELEELLEYAYQMVQVDRHNEAATRAIIDADLQAGNAAQAQRRLQLFWDSVQRDLGVRPTEEFHALRDRIQSLLSA